MYENFILLKECHEGNTNTAVRYFIEQKFQLDSTCDLNIISTWLVDKDTVFNIQRQRKRVIEYLLDKISPSNPLKTVGYA